MPDQALATFPRAVHCGDQALIRAALAEQVVLHSPILAEPIIGPDAVSAVLGLLPGIIEELSFGEVLTGEGRCAVRLSGRIGTQPIEAVDLVAFDPEGKIDAVTVLARPLDGVIAPQNRLAPALGAPVLSLVAEPAGQGPGR